MAKPTLVIVATMLLSACASPARLLLQVSAPAPLRGPGVSVDVTLTNHGRRPTKRVAVRCNYFDAAGVLVLKGATFFNAVKPGASETNGQMVLSPSVVRGDCAVR